MKIGKKRLRKFSARHYSLGFRKEFEYKSIAEARKFNPAFIEWQEINTEELPTINLSRNKRMI